LPIQKPLNSACTTMGRREVLFAVHTMCGKPTRPVLRRTAALLTALFLIFLRAGAAPAEVSPQDHEAYFRFRLERITPQDHAALLRLGKWCEKNGHRLWARTCYRRVVELGKSDSYSEAAFRLARLELEAGKTQRALRRLHELVSAYGHKEAARLLEQAETLSIKRARALAEEAQEAAQEGLWSEAKKKYREALRILREAGGDPEAEARLLREAGKCQQALEDAFRRREGLEREGPYPRCPDCGEAEFPGVVPCPASCGGKSRCPKCRGWSVVPCPTCGGLACLIADPAGSRIREVLMQTLTSPRMHRLGLRQATAEITKALLDLSQPELLQLARVEPPWKEMRIFWDVIPSVPLPRTPLNEAIRRYNAAASRPELRMAFLISYACRFALAAARFDLFRCVRKPLYRAPRSEDLLGRSGKSLLEIAAFPEHYAGVFTVTTATIKGTKQLSDFSVAVLSEVSPARLIAFAWRPEALKTLSRLDRGSWKKHIGRLPELYPHRTAEALYNAAAKWRYRLAGRLLRNPSRIPSSFFEVWYLEPLYPASLAPLVKVLGRPFHLALRDARLSELISIVKTLFGVKIRLQGIAPGRRINLISEGCSLGRVLLEAARACGFAVYADETTVVFAPNGPKEATASFARAVMVVSPKPEGFLAAGSLAAETETHGVVASSPLAGYKEALKRLAFGEAALHLRMLLATERDRKKRAALKRYLALVEIGKILLDGVPLSPFLKAKELSKLTIRNPKGEETTRTVLILERSPKGVTVQGADGTVFTVPASAVRGEEKLPAALWKSNLEKLLSDRMQRALRARGRLKASELLSALLLAKRLGLVEETTKLLRELVASEGFPWIAGTFLPEESERLLALRKDLGLPGEAPTAVAQVPPPEKGRQEAEASSTGGKPSPLGPQRLGGGAPEPASPPQSGSISAGEPPLEGPLPSDPAELLKTGLRHLEAGKRHRRRSLPGSGGVRSEIKTALLHFKRARTALARYLKMHDDPEVRRKLTEATILLQGCVKDLPFFD